MVWNLSIPSIHKLNLLNAFKLEKVHSKHFPEIHTICYICVWGLKVMWVLGVWWEYIHIKQKPCQYRKKKPIEFLQKDLSFINDLVNCLLFLGIIYEWEREERICIAEWQMSQVQQVSIWQCEWMWRCMDPCVRGWLWLYMHYASPCPLKILPLMESWGTREEGNLGQV